MAKVGTFINRWEDVNILIARLQDLFPVGGTLNVRIGVRCYWTDPRLKGRSWMDPFPTELWSQLLNIDDHIVDLGKPSRKKSAVFLNIVQTGGGDQTHVQKLCCKFGVYWRSFNNMKFS